MKTFEVDNLTTIEANVLALIPQGEEFEFECDVVLFDHRVSNPQSAKVFITNELLFITYDSLIEKYSIRDLEVNMSGLKPEFNLVRIWAERVLSSYTKNDLLKININEKGKPAFDIAVRNGSILAYSFQTWALSKLIRSFRDDLEIDNKLYSMIRGDYTDFNNTTILYFIFMFVSYFLIILLFASRLPQILLTLLNWGFGIIAIMMGIWVYISMQKVLDGYKEFYRSFLIGRQRVK